MIESLDLESAPTPEEIETLGPDFIERLLERTRQRVQEE